MDETQVVMDLLRQQHADIQALQTDITQIKVALAGIDAKLCPAPGACNGIQVIVNQHSKRMDKLEKWRWQLAGALAVAIPILTIIGNAAARKLIP